MTTDEWRRNACWGLLRAGRPRGGPGLSGDRDLTSNPHGHIGPAHLLGTAGRVGACPGW